MIFWRLTPIGPALVALLSAITALPLMAAPDPPVTALPIATRLAQADRARSPLPQDRTSLRYLLNRIGFGPKPGDLERVQQMGTEAYIQAQLHPEQLPESADLTAALSRLETLQLTPAQLIQDYYVTAAPPQPAAKPGEAQSPVIKQNRKTQRVPLQQAVQGRLLRAVRSDRQLQEAMVDFWYSHFNVNAEKGRDRAWVGVYEETAIRPHALGKFRDLLGATAKHPAMAFYLDNIQNTGPKRPGAQRPTQNSLDHPADPLSQNNHGNLSSNRSSHRANRPSGGVKDKLTPNSPTNALTNVPTNTIANAKTKGLNENYARELMELHTLGVDGGYTQQDVITLAKILTGWGYPQTRQPSEQPVVLTGFAFEPKRHDFSDKTFLGQAIPGSGLAEGETALDILARHPKTAQNISFQLAQYFVSDTPPPALVQRLAQTFTATDGDIRAVMDQLLHSPEFWAADAVNAKFKTPYQYVVSAVRASGVTPTQNLDGVLQQMGMPLYRCPTPDGYKNTEAAWLNPEGMTRRISFATALGRMPGVDADRLTATLGNPFGPNTQQIIATSDPGLRAALMLGSPEFNRR
jgi:uncharacterized protein (DUF1800 family)